MAKKKGEFEKMGDLGKGMGESEESAEDVIKEIEDFDATKGKADVPESESHYTSKDGEPKEKKKKKEESDESTDADSLKEELEREKEKSKNLAEILEKVSAANEEDAPKANSAEVDSKLRSIESKINDNVQSQMKDVKNAITAMSSKIDEATKDKGEKSSSKLRDMVDKVQADTSKRMSDLEEEIKKMIDRMEQPKKEEEVSKGLAVFGGRVDIKNDMLDLKSSIKDVEKSVRELKEETDTRITRIREQIKSLEKLPNIEEKLEGLIERMSPANIEKLKKFIFSADEITAEVIPNEVEKKLTKELTPVFNDIKGVKDDIEKLGENIKTIFNEINYFKGEIKTLYKMGDYISELQSEKEKTHSRINEKEANLINMLNKLDAVVKKRTEMLNERIEKFDKMFTEKIYDKTKEFFDEFTESKFAELEDRTQKNLAVSRVKVNDMFSKFVQFQNVVNPTLSMMKEEMEKTNTRLEKVKAGLSDFGDEMEEKVKDMFEDIAGPRIKDISSESSRFIKNMSGRVEDIEAEFVQFQNVVNPTLTMFKNDVAKLDSRLEKLKTGEDSLKEDMKAIADIRKSTASSWEWMKSTDARQKEAERRMLVLESRLNEVAKEFDTIVKQTLSDRKRFEDEAKKQREKINILLKELKS